MTISDGFDALCRRLYLQALEIVKRDMRACGLPGTGHLYIWEGRNAFVEVWDRYNSHGSGCHPTSGSDPVTALATVADDAQDAVMHAIFGVWPVCVAHSLGTHAEERDGTAVWWCSGAGGHMVALIGQWAAQRPQVAPSWRGPVLE